MHDTWLAVFVMLTALAFLLQALALAGIYVALQNLHRDLKRIQAETHQKLEALRQHVTEFVAETREPVRSVAANLADITRMLRDRTAQWDGVVADLADRTRLQIIRFDQMVTGLVEKAESTAGVVEKSVVAPIQEVSAVIAGVRKGLEFLFTRRRSSSAREAAQDEQMFI
jgi:heme oxygenase